MAKPFLEFLQKYTSSRPETTQVVYTDILVSKSVNISAGQPLILLRAVNERASKTSFCIYRQN